MQQIRGRFAPSPSGEMHLGNVWTALLAWLAARKSGGAIILRMEDLDPDRSRPEYARQIISDLHWLGLDWDEGPDIGGPYGSYNQNERRHLYESAIQKLTERGLIYPCYCSRVQLHSPTLAPHASEAERPYLGTCRTLTTPEVAARQQGRDPLLRIKVPDQVISFIDQVCGEYRQRLPDTCGDFIVRRSDGIHAYQLAVVVDDALMAINQVVRGSDLLPSTPRQLYLYEALELPPPTFAHVPLLCDPNGHRLSKRQQALSLASIRKCGISPETVIGFLAWRAGLIEKNEPLAAHDLISGFAFTLLSRESVVIEGAPKCE